jgi:hypothetical protein
MKTPEQILDEVAAENMINIQQMVTTKQLAITAIRRYAKLYHQSKVKNLALSGVSNSALLEELRLKLIDMECFADEQYNEAAKAGCKTISNELKDWIDKKRV